ncbi:MAG: anhydro-N-acetylmuramic acid kinase [Gemmatimonadales bacterium]|nr:anhydro-N-acetylmuramic acid kinase [Gemmatimonadales bacterium]MXX77430.1 anhydro-N-acetylmuramic acid kinase [Gemmatimonadales bacterium]MYC87391.1 anhydro-N-acetylmuramic acid kinase [Candidatus Palauibacter denitrificans]
MTLWVGVMSGTSLDGIDVAVVETAGDGERPADWRVVAFETERYDGAARARIAGAITSGSAAAICALDFELGERIGAAVNRMLAGASLRPADVEAIGSHGQTVWHEPPEGARGGATLQLGQAAVIAERTSCTVVSDFRVRDMAAGGEGAPLTAYTDWLLFRARESRAIQNIGGIGNVTALPAESSGATPQAYDTGPGVVLIDGAVEFLTEGRSRFDLDGEMARRGVASDDALSDWLSDPFFSRPPPRSTGRERFSRDRLLEWLRRHAALSPEDTIATLTELTARTIADAYRWIEEPPAGCYLSGGGARNPALASRLEQLLDPVPVRDLSALGLDADAREAVAFALLARQHVLGYPANAPWATGARGPRLLGVRTAA